MLGVSQARAINVRRFVQELSVVAEWSAEILFVLVVMPRTNGGVDEASEEEEKADKQYDPDHATVKSVSFA